MANSGDWQRQSNTSITPTYQKFKHAIVVAHLHVAVGGGGAPQVPKVEAAPSLEERLSQELAPVLKHLNQAALNESTIEMLLVNH